MKTMRIHLLRHGLTQGNLDGLYVGHTDMPLCEQGRKQLLEMKKSYLYPACKFVISSPLKRCLETANLLFPEIKPLVMRELIEYDFGEFEGKTAAELHEKQPLFDRWLSGEPDVEPPFGESNAAFASRVCECFRKIVEGVLKSDAEDVYVITHGGVLMTLLSAFGLPEAPPTDWLTPSGCGYTLRIDPAIWMAGEKAEVIEEIPRSPQEHADHYYDGWDYYPADDNFNVNDYLYDEPLTEEEQG